MSSRRAAPRAEARVVGYGLPPAPGTGGPVTAGVGAFTGMEAVTTEVTVLSCSSGLDVLVVAGAESAIRWPSGHPLRVTLQNPEEGGENADFVPDALPAEYNQEVGAVMCVTTFTVPVGHNFAASPLYYYCENHIRSMRGEVRAAEALPGPAPAGYIEHKFSEAHGRPHEVERPMVDLWDLGKQF
jgi:hypothetical protein